MLAVTQPAGADSVPVFGRVAWSRGKGCLPLAEALADDKPTGLGSDLASSCVDNGVDFLVARRAARFDLVPTATPHSIDLESTTSVTAAIGDGPHSKLAAAVAARLAGRLDVPGELATVFRTEDASSQTMHRLGLLADLFPQLGTRAIKGATARDLIDTLSPATLLIVGAPGGSWFQRQLVGPGHRLLVAAPAGTVVVRSAPRRCYREAVDARGIAVSPLLSLIDARSLVTLDTVPVAHEGRLVGILRAVAVAAGSDAALVADVMEPVVAVGATEPIDAIGEIADFMGRGPVPVIDRNERLVGVIPHSTAQNWNERHTP